MSIQEVTCTGLMLLDWFSVTLKMLLPVLVEEGKFIRFWHMNREKGIGSSRFGELHQLLCVCWEKNI